jgi:hypothetical protein
MAPPILGSTEPRIFTPERRELTPETSHGHAAIAFAEGLGFRLFPWQRWLLMHALELDPDDDRLYRFRTVVVEVARQAGKTTTMLILALWHIYARDSKMVIGTAQDLANSERAWSEAVEIAQGDEDLAARIEKITLGHPKSLKLITGPEYRVATASRRGGRGFSGDLILLDELREHQSWDSWSAVTKTMMARPRAQAWAFSNAGDTLSVVLRYLRAQAHRDLGWPDGDADQDVLGELDTEMEDLLADGAADFPVGWFEWSAPPSAKRTDRHAWAHANPSLNHTAVTPDCVTDRALIHALRTDPPHVFETECLCRWTSMADAGPFPEGSWAATLDNNAAPVGRQVVCVDVSWNRARTYIARAGHDAAGVVIVGIAEDRAGTDWVIPWLVANRSSFEGIVVQSNGAPVTSLYADMAAARLPDGSTAQLPLIDWKGTDLATATGMLFDRLDTRKIRHLAHPGLDAAATTASVKVLAQGSWVIDRAKSITDAAPLQAVVGAVWGAETLAPAPEYDILASVW